MRLGTEDGSDLTPAESIKRRQALGKPRQMIAVNVPTATRDPVLLLSHHRSCPPLESVAYSSVNRLLHVEHKVLGTRDVADDNSGDSSGAGKRLGDVHRLLVRRGSGDHLRRVEYIISHFGGFV